ncbi:hypothetical protein WR25_12375 [Diploscapter pachys]|uniref:Uncharacterized protein n=1 Tax=Diploscapter pachys TaxID=2018661 RepID=A0A2A2JA21_9BILA|nr:hypothetical protein WR25_12375 [Diploscapter pachys]
MLSPAMLKNSYSRRTSAGNIGISHEKSPQPRRRSSAGLLEVMPEEDETAGRVSPNPRGSDASMKNAFSHRSSLGGEEPSKFVRMSGRRASTMSYDKNREKKIYDTFENHLDYG